MKTYINVDEFLKEKYEQDKYLNNIYRSNSRNVWKWDFIGDNMLHNPNAKNQI